MNAVLKEVEMSGEGANLEPRVVTLESDVRRHGDKLEKMMERSDRQFEVIRQEFLGEIRAMRAEFSAEIRTIHAEIKGIHSELNSIRDSIASMRVWAVTFGFGLAASILGVMAQAFGWLH